MANGNFATTQFKAVTRRMAGVLIGKIVVFLHFPPARRNPPQYDRTWRRENFTQSNSCAISADLVLVAHVVSRARPGPL